MRVSKKLRIISIIGIVVVGSVVIACANLGDDTKNGVHVTPQSTAKWKTKAPEIFNNAGYSKLVETTKTDANISKSQAALIGTVTNPFGIRDDILDYILVSIPESNIRARIAEIKLAQLEQSELGVNDDKMLNMIENKTMAAVYCAHLPIQDSAKFVKGYDKLLRNTTARQVEQDRIEHLLNGHVISADFGIDTYDYKKQCDYFLGFDK